jgi:hypothetical protein
MGEQKAHYYLFVYGLWAIVYRLMISYRTIEASGGRRRTLGENF